MGEIADGLINGDFDFYTGEYLGRGYGTPRTKNKSLSWERRNKQPKFQKDFLSSKEIAYKGVKNYIAQKWNGRKDTPNVRVLVYEYTGESNFDLKAKCLDIQKEWKRFIQWINNKIKQTNTP